LGFRNDDNIAPVFNGSGTGTDINQKLVVSNVLHTDSRRRLKSGNACHVANNNVCRSKEVENENNDTRGLSISNHRDIAYSRRP
jgi:hypothetical protein